MPEKYQIFQRLNIGGQSQVFKALDIKESEFLVLKITNFAHHEFSDNHTSFFYHRLIENFYTLQMNNVAHRDVKTSNIIMVENKDLKGEVLIKIGDFGDSFILEHNTNEINLKLLQVFLRFTLLLKL